MTIEHTYGCLVVLERLRQAIDELAGLDPDSLGASALEEAVVEIARERSRLEAVESRLLARWDASQEWRSSGARSAAAYLALRTRLPAQECGRRLKVARALRTLPKIAASWVAGRIDAAHVHSLLRVRNPRTEAAFEEAHEHLVHLAETQPFADFQLDCDTWRDLADQDGARRRDADDLACRDLHLDQSIGGLWFGRMTLDPISGEIVETALREIEDELYLHDKAEARERLGRDPLSFELCRNRSQRRADALVEMASRAKTAPRDGRAPKPLFTVVAGRPAFDQVIELWSRRHVVNPAAAARWLAEADLEQILFDGQDRVLEVGRRTRFYRGALRRAIEVRDRRCFHPTCDEVPRWPQVDHEEEYSQGGETTQENGRLGCDFHNNRRNHHSDDWVAADLWATERTHAV
jgi:hypothetical protein